MTNLNDHYNEDANPANEMIKSPMIFKSELVCVNGYISEDEVEKETDNEEKKNDTNINDNLSNSFWDIPKDIEEKVENENKSKKDRKAPIRVSQITTVIAKQNKINNDNHNNNNSNTNIVTKRKYKKRGRKPNKKYIQKQIDVNKQINENQEKIEVAKSSPLFDDNVNRANEVIDENDDDLIVNDILNKNNITVMSDEITRVDLPVNSQTITTTFKNISTEDNDPIKNIISMIEQETNNKVKEMERKLNIEQKSVENDIKLHYDKLRNDGKIKIAREINKFFLAYVSGNQNL